MNQESVSRTADNPTSNRESLSSELATSRELVSQSHSEIRFPAEAYEGVIGEFADLYSKHYESPKEFLYFDMLTLLGAYLTGKVRMDFGALMTEPRIYQLKIAKSGHSRKSTSVRIAERFLREALRSTGEDEDQLKILRGVGSAEGLVGALERNHNIVVSFDEFRRFEKKSGVKSSVLQEMLNELFERNEYANCTKNDFSEISDAHVSFMSNTTDDCFSELLNAGELEDIGFLNRLLLVTGSVHNRIPRPTEPPSEDRERVQRKLQQCFATLRQHARPGEEFLMRLTAAATTMWDDWYYSLQETRESARLDTLGMRLMPILAFSDVKTEIDEEVMRRVLALLEYQREIRESFRPNQGQNPVAKMENKIRHELEKRRGEAAERQLWQFTNASRDGAETFNRALKALETAGIIRLKTGRPKTWILAKEESIM